MLCKKIRSNNISRIPNSSIRQEHPMDIFSENIRFHVDTRPDPFTGQYGDIPGVRNQGNFEPIISTPHYGQTDSIYSHGTLWDNERTQILRKTDMQDVCIVSRCYRN